MSARGFWRLTACALAALCCLASVSVLQAADRLSEESRLASASRAVVRGAADYGFRRWLRNRIWDEQEDAARYGLQLDEDWQAVAAESPALPLTVLVHGFNSTPQKNASVLEPLRTVGVPCGSFAYPNDWDIEESAALLSRQLTEFAERHPGQSIALVTHSMGGLVARACVEDSRLDPGNVNRLIMIAPPSHGTMLAHAAIATDVWEHWFGRADGGCWTRWRDSVVDGLGEAADDLIPGSPFLTRVNARPRNARIRYSIFLGTDASVSEGEMDWIRSALQATGGHCPGLRGCTNRVNHLLADMEELVDGKGDGVVALKRGRLAGVDDVLVLPFGHLNCTGQAECEGVRRLQAEVLARLQ